MVKAGQPNTHQDVLANAIFADVLIKCNVKTALGQESCPPAEKGVAKMDYMEVVKEIMQNAFDPWVFNKIEKTYMGAFDEEECLRVLQKHFPAPDKAPTPPEESDRPPLAGIWMLDIDTKNIFGTRIQIGHYVNYISEVYPYYYRKLKPGSTVWTPWVHTDQGTLDAVKLEAHLKGQN